MFAHLQRYSNSITGCKVNLIADQIDILLLENIASAHKNRTESEATRPMLMNGRREESRYGQSIFTSHRRSY